MRQGDRLKLIKALDGVPPGTLAEIKKVTHDKVTHDNVEIVFSIGIRANYPLTIVREFFIVRENNLRQTNCRLASYE